MKRLFLLFLSIPLYISEGSIGKSLLTYLFKLNSCASCQ